ncbi:hypothetical protein KKF91_07755 [Myxococcota bacterium]|nr:hypothetical protein [Myxococcota bacterium]MBU1430438.1 hypothetical protein [Myxococcota bacterium]MBU1896491.1 hypothetical protein [Myxococcota bacterium]
MIIPAALAVLLTAPAPCDACAQAEAHGFARLIEGRYQIVLPPTSQPSNREADLFGEAPPKRSAAPPREADLFNAPPPPPPPPQPSPLKAGGRLDIQHDVYLSEDTDWGEQPIDPRYHLRLYADARPSPTARAYTQARLTFDPSEAMSWGGTTTLEQAWLKLNTSRAFITLGVQPIRWGTGRIWNPTDALNPTRRDPLLSTDLRGGISAARIEAPFQLKSLSGALQLITITEGAQRLKAVGGAARLSLAWGAYELILSAMGRGEDLILAAEASGGVGPLEVYGEGSVSWGVERRFTRGGFTPEQLWDALGGSRAASPVAQPIEGASAKALAGVEWPTTLGGDRLHLGAEYLYNGAGDDDEVLYLWRLLQGDPALYLGRHYAGIYALAVDPGPLEHTQLLLTALANLSDGSGLARLTVVYAYEVLRVEPYVGGRFGAEGGELRLKTRIPALGDAPPTQIGPLRAEAGIWLRADF